MGERGATPRLLRCRVRGVRAAHPSSSMMTFCAMISTAPSPAPRTHATRTAEDTHGRVATAKRACVRGAFLRQDPLRTSPNLRVAAHDHNLPTFGGVRSTPGCAPTVRRGGSPGPGLATQEKTANSARRRAPFGTRILSNAITETRSYVMHKLKESTSCGERRAS